MPFFKLLPFPEREHPVLATWLALGFAWFLLGMLFLPSSKLYHQGLIFLFWLLVLLIVFCRAWSNRASTAGVALCSLLAFSVVALMTDGIGPWVKPREEWFTVWLPIFLCFVLRPVEEREYG